MTIQEKYPTANYQPDLKCKWCAGTGERNGNPCICLYVDAEFRDMAAAGLAKTASTLLRELDELGAEHPMVQGAVRLVEALNTSKTTPKT